VVRDGDNSTMGAPRDRHARKFVALVILLVVFVVSLVVARGAGRWLVREDPLSKADVIVVLSGGLPYRADGAASLYKSGYAPAVWISRPEGPQEELAARGIHYVGEEEYNRAIMIQRGVPESAIQIFPETIINTQQEVEELSREMRKAGIHSAIIVTSPEHTRRVKALWTKLVGNDPRVIVRAAAEDPFDRNHWWGNTRDTLSVVRETLGLINVWSGLPVRPHLQ
jgi:uncharacterized SAM-binding protein YcdF (DUF218 family)